MEKKRKTVLVIEDSPFQAQVLQNALEREGLRVLQALGGLAGMAMAQEHLPDVIVLDIVMPQLSGIEVCKRLKENDQTATIPVLMLTAHAEAGKVMDSLAEGAVDFIPKDAFTTEVLVRTLRQLQLLDAPSPRGDERIAD